MLSLGIGLSYVLITSCVAGVSLPCVLKEYGGEEKVCVCNASYCDNVDTIDQIKSGEFITLVSSKAGLRFEKSSYNFTQSKSSSESVKLSWLFDTANSVTMTVDTSIRYQKIMGFGGAFTDSAGMNILSLGKQTQEHLLRSYFSKEGIEYNIGRVPIGGTDFSTHPYSYDDGAVDLQLKNFSLAKEDFKYKIPLIERAMEMSEKDIHLVAASWSPPPWMKTNNDYSGFAFLKEEYYDVYTKYLLRFLDEYKKHNLTIWAMSTGNEPSNGVLPYKKFNSLGWTPVTIADWISNYFGPQLRNSTHKDVRVLVLDDQRLFLPWWIELMVKANKNVLKYTDGFAIHWYWDFLIGPNVIDTLQKKYPEKFILYTEASQGDKPWEKKVEIGSWKRGENYIADIIQNLNAWVTGWIDWNLALDTSGGPTWAKNNVDSPILVNASANEFYKQPMFYAIGHFSKFIERDAVRVHLSPTDSNGVHATAVQNPDGRIIIVMMNEGEKNRNVSINVPDKGWINLELALHSFMTILC